MMKLIRLEWKKNDITKYVRSAFIMSMIFLLLLLSVASELEKEKYMVYAGAELFANMSFIIFTSVMLASFIVSSYKNKTIHVMFSYPISRKKILLSQMSAVWIFNFIALVLTKIFHYSMLSMTKKYTHITAASIPLGNSTFYIGIIINSAVMVSISFIALLIGLRRKSSKATIIGGVVIACLTQGNVGAYTLTDNILFKVTLLIAASIAVFLSLYKLETRDVL